MLLSTLWTFSGSTFEILIYRTLVHPLEKSTSDFKHITVKQVQGWTTFRREKEFLKN